MGAKASVAKAKIKSTDINDLAIMTTYELAEFIDQAAAEKYLCSICHNVLHNPTMINNSTETLGKSCGHYFCYECIKEALEINPTCPLCRRPSKLKSLIMLSFMDVAIGELKITCPFALKHAEAKEKPSCDWTGVLGNNGSNRRKHLTVDCPMRGAKCGKCNQLVAWSAIVTHLNLCPKDIVACSNRSLGCQKYMERESVAKHLREQCDYRAMQCTFRDLGHPTCAKIKTFLDYRTHMADCISLHQTLIEIEYAVSRAEQKQTNAKRSYEYCYQFNIPADPISEIDSELKECTLVTTSFNFLGTWNIRFCLMKLRNPIEGKTFRIAVETTVDNYSSVESGYRLHIVRLDFARMPCFGHIFVDEGIETSIASIDIPTWNAAITNGTICFVAGIGLPKLAPAA